LKKDYFIYPQTKYYRETLELKHLKGQNNLVLSMIFGLMILTVTYMILSKYPFLPILAFGIAYLVIILFNIAAIAYGVENTYYLKFNKYITSITLFTLVLVKVIYFGSPSIIPFLFVAYAICSLYKDNKVLLTISFYFLFSMLMLIMNFKVIFDFENQVVIKDLAIGFFVIMFLLVLMFSTFIIIKEKTFFYNNVAYAKEKEYRNLDFLLDFKLKNKRNDFHQRNYYQDTEKILDDFSKKIEIPNVFSEKIQIIQDLEKSKDYQSILKEHPDFTEVDLKRLENLVINKKSKLRRTILKIKNSKLKNLKTKEIFSAIHFQSFNKQADSIDIKILCFVVYYVALKKGLPGMKSVSNKELYDTFVNSDFYHFIDPKVIRIFEENEDVFNTIIEDTISEVIDND
jgi:hypothetical protein